MADLDQVRMVGSDLGIRAAQEHDTDSARVRSPYRGHQHVSG